MQIVVFPLFLFPICYGTWHFLFFDSIHYIFCSPLNEFYVMLLWLCCCFGEHQLRKKNLSQNKRLQFEDGCKAKYLQFFGCSIKCGRLLVCVWLWARIWCSTDGEECSSMKNLTPLQGYAISIAPCVLIEGMQVLN